MIDRDEIDAASRRLGVNAANVQRDYIFGWLLAGLFTEGALAGRLVLKGGNALRKGYFAATRFSEDLDLAAPRPLDPALLLDTLNDACRMVQANTGIVFDLPRNRQTGARAIDREKTVFKYQLYFTDFHGTTSSLPISLRVDVTEFGRLHLPARERQLVHPYSDHSECAAQIRVVALEEALADKLKCLLQRRSSFDLFDLVYSIFVNAEVGVDQTMMVSTFLKKTIFGSSPPAARALLHAVPFDAMRPYWENKILCDRTSLLDFDSAVERFRGALGTLFAPFPYGERNRAAFYPAHMRTAILEAGTLRTALRVVYDGVERLVEPYALVFKRRKDGVAQEYLYVWDRTGGRSSAPGVKTLLNWKIAALSGTDIRFEPRYEIELAKAGEFGARTGFGSGARSRGLARSGRTRPMPGYRLRCVRCGRSFQRTTASVLLGAHKDGYGNACPGRLGVRV